MTPQASTQIDTAAEAIEWMTDAVRAATEKRINLVDYVKANQPDGLSVTERHMAEEIDHATTSRAVSRVFKRFALPASGEFYQACVDMVRSVRGGVS